jgi:hypothetical protein
MGPSRKTLAFCALLGLGLIVAGCGAANTTGTPRASSTSAPASTTTTPPASSPVAAPSSPAPSASPASALPGVVAECTNPPPLRLSTRPAEIVLACADDGIGVEHLTWNSWASGAAAGQGLLWENLCQPNCATGKIATYPVAVTLSAVKTSSQGPYFSSLALAWQGNRPPNSTPDTFGLLPPSSSGAQ